MKLNTGNVHVMLLSIYEFDKNQEQEGYTLLNECKGNYIYTSAVKCYEILKVNSVLAKCVSSIMGAQYLQSVSCQCK